MGHHAIKQRAAAYLAAAKENAPTLKMEAELKKRDETIAELQETVNALLAREKAANAAKTPPPKG
jgi:ABC-type enterochelin transport system substrate-binding protein